jgi:hypothetical protein
MARKKENTGNSFWKGAIIFAAATSGVIVAWALERRGSSDELRLLDR